MKQVEVITSNTPENLTVKVNDYVQENKNKIFIDFKFIQSELINGSFLFNCFVVYKEDSECEQ